MNRPLIIGLLFVGVALAGCTTDEGMGGPPGTDEDVTEEGGPSMPAPQWQVGNAWTWESSGTGSIEQFVVTEVGPDQYTMDTTTDQLAFEEQVFDHPAIGTIDADHLTLVDHDSNAKWFDFPLEPGKTWTTQWFDNTYTSTAVELLPDGRFHLQSHRDDGSLYLDYHYSEQVGWFDDFTFHDAEGTPGTSIDVIRDPDVTIGLVRASVTELVSVSGTGPHQETEADWDFSDTTDADVYANLFLSCSQGTAFVGVGTVESIAQPTSDATGIDDGFSFLSPCPFDDAYYGLVGDDPDQGTWGYTVDVASDDAAWGLTAWLAEYERFTVGA